MEMPGRCNSFGGELYQVNQLLAGWGRHGKICYQVSLREPARDRNTILRKQRYGP